MHATCILGPHELISVARNLDSIWIILFPCCTNRPSVCPKIKVDSHQPALREQPRGSRVQHRVIHSFSVFCQVLSSSTQVFRSSTLDVMEARSKVLHKRSVSALKGEHLQVQLTVRDEVDCIQLLEQFAPEEGPQHFEDFHSFLAREGCISHPWIDQSAVLDPVLPASDEDFIAYLARSNGIIDSGTITKLRQVLEPSHNVQEPVSQPAPTKCGSKVSFFSMVKFS